MNQPISIALLSGCLLCAVTAFATPAIIAHRGASYDAPENTLAAFTLAWEQGADGIEGDFYLTKDGEIVCMHDDTAKRTAGKTLKLAEATLAELRELDAGSWKGPQWKGTRIPTLDEVLATVPKGRRIFIEVKCGPEILPALEKALARSKLGGEQVVVISFSTAVIAETKRRLPRLKAFWLTDFKTDKETGIVSPSVEQVLATLEKTGADGVDCRAKANVDEPFMKALRGARKEVHAWTVDDEPTARRLRDLGIDSLTTNRPGWLRQQLGNGTKKPETADAASGALGAGAAPRP